MSILDWFSSKKKASDLQVEERVKQVEASLQLYVDTHKSSDPVAIRSAYMAGLQFGYKMAGECFGVKY